MASSKVRVLGLHLFVDGTRVADESMRVLQMRKSQLFQNSTWLAFDSGLAEIVLGPVLDQVNKAVTELRNEGKHLEAAILSDRMFESLTPAVKLLHEAGRYEDANSLWLWALERTREWELANGFGEGQGVHKGTGFYFMGLTRLLSSNWDDAFLAFAEAEREDRFLPSDIVILHHKGLPPAAKFLILDLSEGHFARPVVKNIHEELQDWEANFPNISQSAIMPRIKSALEQGAVPQNVAITVGFSVAKAYAFNKWRTRIRPTGMATLQGGIVLLTFNRALEEFIRAKLQLTATAKAFEPCHTKWFSTENWSSIPGYHNNLESLVEDFLSLKWGISTAGSNMVLSLKLRNALAHGIPVEPKLLENFRELVLAILSSIAFICDNP